MHEREYFAWVEKYRPQTLDECILPTSVKQTLEATIQQQNTTNLLLVGRAGTGKTTVAKAIVREFGSDALVINASETGKIDTLRTLIRDYASTLSLDGKRKYVILDEADYLTAATQPALRSFMEEFSMQCGFILTANYPQRIIQPLHSRCSVVDFKIPSSERATIATAFWARACKILKDEKIEHDPKVVSQVIAMYFPDFCRVLNELQRFSSERPKDPKMKGRLSDAIMSQLSDRDITELFTALKARGFDNVRKWVALHEDMDSPAFYHMMMEQVPKRVSDMSNLAELIITMADYSYRSALSADYQLNTLACLLEMMHNGKWK